MTVGIAAIASSGEESNLIFATDQMMSVGVRTADLPLVTKGFKIHRRWFTLYAGTVTLVPPILEKVSEALTLLPDASAVEVSSAFVRVYQEERLRLAEQTILSPFGLDMRTFVSQLSNNRSAGLADMERRIQYFDFDCEFLVGGFDPDKRAHLFTVTPPGVENHYDAIGFWSIGSGAEAALSSLMFRGLNFTTPLKRAIYYVAEAKFLSECAVGVGRGSLFIRMSPDGTGGVLFGEETRPLRQLWEAEGQPPIPPNLDERVPDFVSLDEATRRKAARTRPSGSQTSEGQP